MRKDLEIIILAAGKGSRMKTRIPKILNKLHNKTLINHVIEKSRKLKPSRINIIVNKNLNSLQKKIPKINYIIQTRPLGTGHALKLYYKKTNNVKKYLVVLYADAPLINLKDILKIYKNLKKKNDLIVIGAEVNRNKSHGIIVKKSGKISKIVEFSNANTKEKKIKMCNTGVIGLKSKFLNLTSKIKKNKSKNEYLITDIVNIAYQKKLSIGLIKTRNSYKSFGVNTIDELNRLKCL